jgi:uncharacterized protein (DUF488 family)
MIQVYSIGYETHTPQTFFARLKREGVNCLIDVRNVAASRKPGFSKKALAAACEEHGILYVHQQKLGNPKSIRDKIKKGKTSVDVWKREYEKYLASNPEALDEAIALIEGYKSCIMCLEHSHTVCHRDVIIETLRKRMKHANVTYLE